ncbi:hypothetical protein D3C87_851230 [compost metagenome]
MEMAGDVFAHHDGVIHENADGKRQRQQAERIERETEEIDHRERADDGDRQCQPGNHRAAPGIEEQEDDGDGERRTFDQRRLYLTDGFADGYR